MDNKVFIWNPRDGSQINELAGPEGEIQWLSWHPSPKVPAIVAGDSKGMMWMWNAKTAKCANVFVSRNEEITTGGFRPDGTSLFSAGDDSDLRIWGLRTKTPTAVVCAEHFNFHREPVIVAAVSFNGALIATGDVSGMVYITRWDDAKVLGKCDNGEQSIESVAFSPDGKFLAVASMCGACNIWDTNTMKMRHSLAHEDLEGNPAGLTCVKWHPSQPYVITSAIDGVIRVYDVRNGQLLDELTGHTAGINCIDVKSIPLPDGAPNPDGIFIVSGGDEQENQVRLFTYVEQPNEPEAAVEQETEAET